MTTVYFDASGYTGEDLIVHEQKTFVLASIYMTEDECKKIKNDFFAKIQANELKYTKMKKRPKQIEMAITFFEHMVNERNKDFKLTFGHKELIGIQKIADVIVESAWHESGRDFYHRGHNIAFSNALFFFATRIGVSKQLIHYFYEFMKFRNEEYYDKFVKYLEETSKKDKYLKSFILEIYKSLKFLGLEYFIKYMPKLTVSIEGGLAVQQLCDWSSTLSHKFDVLYDRSKEIDEIKDVILELSSPNAPQGVYGHDRRITSFPLKIRNICAVDSKDYVGIQLCDILAGLIRTVTDEASDGRGKFSPNSERIYSLFGQAMPFALWPSTDVTPDELGTVAPNKGSLLDEFVKAKIKLIK